MRSVRSTAWSLGATIGLSIAIGILATVTEANRWSRLSAVERLHFDPTSQSLTGLLFGQLAIGVLVVSAEYSTGSIRATLSAIPNRPAVLAAKVLVFGVVAVGVGVASSLAAFIIGQSLLTGAVPHATLGEPGVLRAVVGGGLYLAVLGLFALGLASIIRYTDGAITAFVGAVLILPLVLQALPSSIQDAVGRYLPANIGVVMTTVRSSSRVSGPIFSPWVGLAVLGGTRWSRSSPAGG
ncbi:MAG: ABC transporter permease [Actinomycetes bacterium]